MDAQLWLILLNSAAGVGAAAGWAWFARIRIAERHWWLAAVDVLMTLLSATVGVAFVLVYMQHPWTDLLLRMLTFLAAPILVLPVVLHIHQWAKGQRFVSVVEDGDPDGG